MTLKNTTDLESNLQLMKESINTQSIEVIQELLNITIRKHVNRLEQLGVIYTNKDNYNYDLSSSKSTIQQTEIKAHLDYLKKLDNCFTFLDSVRNG